MNGLSTGLEGFVINPYLLEDEKKKFVCSIRPVPYTLQNYFFHSNFLLVVEWELVLDWFEFWVLA